MRAEVLSVGDEVVAGQIVDSNAAWIAEQLVGLGIEVTHHAAVGDDAADVEAAVRLAAARSDVVVISGGLGPTEDDLTRHGVAAAAGVGLRLDEAALQAILERYRKFGRPMPERNRIQAMMPEGAMVLPNAKGTAAGFIVSVAECAVAAMPGVPHEMKAMFAGQVAPFVTSLPIERKVLRLETLRLFGMPESAVNEAIQHLMDRDANPVVGLLVSHGVITVKFTATADSEPAAAALIAPVREEARRILGRAVFGEGSDTLEERVGELLAEQRKTLAVAESCTGGLIGHLLTNVPGISAVLLEDVVAYSNEAKMEALGVSNEALAAEGAVSKRVAASMARGVRKRSGADFGLSTTGIAGPGGGSPEKPVGLVYFGWATGDDVAVERVTFVGDRAVVKDRAARYALDMLRLHLTGQSEWDRRDP